MYNLVIEICQVYIHDEMLFYYTDIDILFFDTNRSNGK